MTNRDQDDWPISSVLTLTAHGPKRPCKLVVRDGSGAVRIDCWITREVAAALLAIAFEIDRTANT
jgi:hypothetical protein